MCPSSARKSSRRQSSIPPPESTEQQSPRQSRRCVARRPQVPSSMLELPHDRRVEFSQYPKIRNPQIAPIGIAISAKINVLAEKSPRAITAATGNSTAPRAIHISASGFHGGGFRISPLNFVRRSVWVGPPAPLEPLGLFPLLLRHEQPENPRERLPVEYRVPPIERSALDHHVQQVARVRSARLNLLPPDIVDYQHAALRLDMRRRLVEARKRVVGQVERFRA